MHLICHNQFCLVEYSSSRFSILQTVPQRTSWYIQLFTYSSQHVSNFSLCPLIKVTSDPHILHPMATSQTFYPLAFGMVGYFLPWNSPVLVSRIPGFPGFFPAFLLLLISFMGCSSCSWPLNLPRPRVRSWTLPVYPQSVPSWCPRSSWP